MLFCNFCTEFRSYTFSEVIWHFPSPGEKLILAVNVLRGTALRGQGRRAQPGSPCGAARCQVGGGGARRRGELWAVASLMALLSQEKGPVPRGEVRNVNHRDAKGLMSHLGGDPECSHPRPRGGCESWNRNYATTCLKYTPLCQLRRALFVHS